MAILRLTLIRLQETPKFLVSNNRDQEAVEILQRIAQKHNRICSLTIEDLESLGKVEINDDYRKHIDIKGLLDWLPIMFRFYFQIEQWQGLLY